LFDGGEERAGERLDGQGIGAEFLDELTELGGFLGFQLFGFLHECLELGVEVARLAGHFSHPVLVGDRG